MSEDIIAQQQDFLKTEAIRSAAIEEYMHIIAHTEIKQRIIKIPVELKEEEKKLLDINRELDRINQEKKRWTRKISIQVFNDVTPDGKKIYTNETLRENETDARLGLLPDYQQLIEEESRQSQLAKLIKIDIDFLEREFKSKQFLIKLLEIEK